MAAQASRQTGNLPIINGVQLIATHAIHDRFKSIFSSFTVFNLVQSKCLPTIFGTNDNFVLSAPSGSGKTVIFEAAICHILKKELHGGFKVVYLAPTKPLCSERLTDWKTKFLPVGLKCAQLTSDTDESQLKDTKEADIIITTPEKLNVITMNWAANHHLLDRVKLILIDQVHILKVDQGAILEAIITRMQAIKVDFRIIALSATIPNTSDIATWLGRNKRDRATPAAMEVFGDDSRPVKQQKHVVGIQQSGGDWFAFDNDCDKELPKIVAQYAMKAKPMLLFCTNNNSAEGAAHVLVDWSSSTLGQDRYWDSPNTSYDTAILHNQLLRDYASSGVAFHHSGLDAHDRQVIEEGYRNGHITVICCTSTSAVGVSLPCDMVILVNTTVPTLAGPRDYSAHEVTQMLGRAGRLYSQSPAVGVIMTRQEKVARYESMLSGTEVLESRLHLNLVEHMNAEVVLGTITDIATATKWLQSTFFYARLTKNPQHYRPPGENADLSPAAIIDSLCKTNLELLQDHVLITPDETFNSTDFGAAMAHYNIQLDTMKAILGLSNRAPVSEILSALAQAAEFRPIRFRALEKDLFKQMNSSPSIRFPIGVDIALPPHKISLMIQAILGGLDPFNDQILGAYKEKFKQELNNIFPHLERLLCCVLECALSREDSVIVRNTLALSRGFAGRTWDDGPLQLRQIKDIGYACTNKLVEGGIKSIAELELVDAQRIEMLLRKNPPFGSGILQDVSRFPKLRVSLCRVGEPTFNIDDRTVLMTIKAEVGFLNRDIPSKWKKEGVRVVLLVEKSGGHVVHFSRMSAQKIGSKETISFEAEFTDPHQEITCYVACEKIPGTLQSASLKPNITSSNFIVEEPEREGEVLPYHFADHQYLSGNFEEDFGHPGLEDADFDDADLYGADLGDADLYGADLGDAYLGGADFGDAYLGDAYLGDANLGDAYLGNAYLGNAYLGGADLGDAYLGGADFGDAYLGDAYPGDAYLGDANLGDAYLGNAYLGDANLADADQVVAGTSEYQDIDDLTAVSELGGQNVCPQQANGGKKRKLTPEPESSSNESSAEPKKLSNGNWECGHTCSNKEKCAHTCCKVGKKDKRRPEKKKRRVSKKLQGSEQDGESGEEGSRPGL